MARTSDNGPSLTHLVSCISECCIRMKFNHWTTLPKHNKKLNESGKGENEAKYKTLN